MRFHVVQTVLDVLVAQRALEVIFLAGGQVALLVPDEVFWSMETLLAPSILFDVPFITRVLPTLRHHDQGASFGLLVW